MTSRVEDAIAHFDHSVDVVRRRLDGLIDDEYLWEPVPDCWSVRPVGGGWQPEGDYPDPDPAPFTTIAWLLVHLTQAVSIMAAGVQSRDVEAGPRVFGTARDAVEEWSRVSADMRTALSGVSDVDLDREFQVFYAPSPAPIGRLVWAAIHETVHHGAEIGRMRDLYRRRDQWKG